MSKYYYHGVGNIICCPDVGQKMINIIKSGGLKSKRLLGMNSYAGFNGSDYISICKKEDMSLYSKYQLNAFFYYIFNSCCFIISDEVDAIETEYFNSKDVDYSDIKIMMNKYPYIRYSDMFDEYQVKDEIPLKYIIGIGLPLNIDDPYLIEDIKKDIEPVCLLARSLNLDIVDTRSMFFVEEYENNKNNNDNKCKILTINNSN